MPDPTITISRDDVFSLLVNLTRGEVEDRLKETVRISVFDLLDMSPAGFDGAPGKARARDIALALLIAGRNDDYLSWLLSPTRTIAEQRPAQVRKRAARLIEMVDEARAILITTPTQGG